MPAVKTASVEDAISPQLSIIGAHHHFLGIAMVALK